MCSLFGILDYKGNLNHKKRIISVLSKECEVRGIDATGYAFIDGGKLRVYKRPYPARCIRLSFLRNTPVIMGHTRLTTQGHASINSNNHPFFGMAGAVKFALAHNGVLYNDVKLRKSMKLPSTHIQTDSYISVQIIEKENSLDHISLKNMAEVVEGSFSFTVLDERGRLHFIKGDSPLCIYHFEDSGFYLYASTESILINTMKKSGLINLRHSAIPIVPGDIITIESNGRITRSLFNTAALFSQYSFLDPVSHYERRCKSNHKTEYLDQIICFAKSCGVSEDEIFALLESGYDEETIEELLYNPALLHRCVDNAMREYFAFGELL